jgi:2-polyprenyl-3-methyl-5-hydroxy-6-metoxy-1,4-benzoquinol methylase
VSEGDTLTQTLRKTAASFLNLFWRNDERRWNRGYAEGHWTFLDAAEQEPRHRVIAGMLGIRGDAASSVLDVGCGTGALLCHLPDNVARYVGIDLSSEAIRICRNKRAGPADRTFDATSFDDYNTVERFGVIVFNEMLYYYPVRRIPEVLARARALLKPGNGTIIVSVHHRSLKKRAVWRRLHAWMHPAQRVEAVDPATGASWRIEQYDVLGTHPHPSTEGLS